jgi:hypothetical protein
MGRKALSTKPVKEEFNNDVKENVSGFRAMAPETGTFGKEPSPSSVSNTRACRVTVEEVEDEDDLISFSPKAGPSRDKGKGADPKNWGDVSSLIDFTEDELRAQHEALLNYAEINRVIKQEEITPHLNFSEEIPARPSSPKAKRGRRRSKSPKVKKASRARVEIPAEESTPSPLRAVEPSMVKSRTVDGDHEGSNDRVPKPGLTAEEVYCTLF